MQNFDFKRYTPRPKKLLRASLRANVTNGQTFGGNRSKINSAHILLLGIVRLAEYRFIFKKIDINGILSKCRF